MPQVTVLGSFMFLVYDSNIFKNVLSQLNLYADDCLLYWVIIVQENSVVLQRNLDTPDIWQMNFNPNNCAIIRCSRSPQVIMSGQHSERVGGGLVVRWGQRLENVQLNTVVVVTYIHMTPIVTHTLAYMLR